MRKPRPGGRHLDTSTVLDLLEGRLRPARARAVEEHLAFPCPDCREKVRDLALVTERMRQDRVPAVPAELHARALEAFASSARPAASPAIAAVLARLLFDSWKTPLPAATRRAVGEARRLRWAMGEGSLELECEPLSSGAVTLRGRLALAEPALHLVELIVGSERLTTWPDAAGSFALDRVPAGRARLAVRGPSGSFRVPGFVL